MKEIEIEFDEANPDIINLETLWGIQGGECTEILDKLQQLIGAENVTVTDKPEKLRKEKIIAPLKPKQHLKNP